MEIDAASDLAVLSQQNLKNLRVEGSLKGKVAKC